MKYFHAVAFLLLVIGGVNWLLYAVFSWEIGSLLGGMNSLLAKIVYVLVGLAAIYEVAMHKKCCALCGRGKNEGTASGSAL